MKKTPLCLLVVLLSLVTIALAKAVPALSLRTSGDKGPAICSYLPGRNYTSASVIKSQIAVSPYACCKLCSEILGCAAATYNSNTYTCVMVRDSSKYAHNVAGVTGVLNKKAHTLQPTSAPTPVPTPAPTAAPNKVAVITCCLNSHKCLIPGDSSCASFASPCGACRMGKPWRVGEWTNYWCPQYSPDSSDTEATATTAVNLSKNTNDPINSQHNKRKKKKELKSFVYKCLSSFIQLETFYSADCSGFAAHTATVLLNQCDGNNNNGYQQGTVIDEAPAPRSTTITRKSQCFIYKGKCQTPCKYRDYNSGRCEVMSATTSTMPSYYPKTHVVTYANFTDNARCGGNYTMQMELVNTCCAGSNYGTEGFENVV